MSSRQTAPESQRWKALLFISIAQLMVIVDGAVMNVALPSAQHALHFTDTSRQWVVTAYGLAFGVCCCSVAGSVTWWGANASS
ncbi:MFS transporter [Plantactinospora sp. CA-294935]|uniref:MFS transporter n=1 Tax=Plantactinospora sp. CA-294935 TaxID=3240012 RepID=UPI003D8DB6E9